MPTEEPPTGEPPSRVDLAKVDLAKVEVIQAAYADKPVLRNLLELYCYDMSEFDGEHIDAHGLYGYQYLDHYWTEAERTPFLVRVHGAWAGFVLVRTEQGNDGQAEHHIAEFFIMKRFRRQGIGRHVAHTVFDRFPGAWVVGELPLNTAAQAFWRKTIHDYTGGHYTEAYDDEFDGIVQRFTARRAPTSPHPT